VETATKILYFLKLAVVGGGMSRGFMLGVSTFRFSLSRFSLCPVAIVVRGFEFVRNICFFFSFYVTSVCNMQHSSDMLYTRYLEHSSCNTCYIFDISIERAGVAGVGRSTVQQSADNCLKPLRSYLFGCGGNAWHNCEPYCFSDLTKYLVYF